MNTMVYGNGFNRLNDVDSWENTVQIINDKSDNLNFPTIYNMREKCYLFLLKQKR